jgi:hypothetical protein
MQMAGRLPVGQRQGDVVIHSLTANIRHVHALFIYFFEGRIVSRWIVTKINFARGTLHCRKTSIPCGDQLVKCGLREPPERIQNRVFQPAQLHTHNQRRFPVVHVNLIPLQLYEITFRKVWNTSRLPCCVDTKQLREKGFRPSKLAIVRKNDRTDCFFVMPFCCFYSSCSRKFLAPFTSPFIFSFNSSYALQYHSLHSVSLGKVSRFVMFNEVADRTIHVRSHKRLINAFRENALK